MFKVTRAISLLACLSLIGCLHNPGTLSKRTSTNECNIKSIKIGHSSEHYPTLNAKRDGENASVLWLTYTPRDVENSPLGIPVVIIKNAHSKESFRVRGVRHAPSDCTIIRKNGEKLYHSCMKLKKYQEANLSTEEIWEFDGLFNIYHRPAGYPLGGIAVSFRISTEQFKEIIGNETAEFYIQTNNQPNRFKVGRKELDSLIKFQQGCFSEARGHFRKGGL